MPSSLQLDEQDRQIVAWLLRDGRASFREIGEAVGLSAPSVKRRVDRLREDGIITGFTATVDPAVLGASTEAYVELFCEGRTAPARIRTALAKYPEVVEVVTVTGDADALVHLRVDGTAGLEAVLEHIRAESIVSRTRSVVVLSRLVDRVAVP